MRSAILLCLLVTFALCELKVKPMKRVVYLRQGRGFTFPALAKMENQLYTVSSNNYGWLEVKDPNSGLSGFVHISEVQDENNRMVLPASPRYLILFSHCEFDCFIVTTSLIFFCCGLFYLSIIWFFID